MSSVLKTCILKASFICSSFVFFIHRSLGDEYRFLLRLDKNFIDLTPTDYCRLFVEASEADLDKRYYFFKLDWLR